MDGRRPDPLTDTELDRELAAAFAVEPSPEFLARVRTRLASDPGPAPRWRLGWFAASAAAATVAVAAVVLTSDMRSVVTLPPPAVERDARPAPERVAARVATVAPPARATARSTPAPARVERAAGERSLPEVLVSPDEQRAFNLLVAVAQDGRMPGLPRHTEVLAGESVAIPDVAIAPLVIEPLPRMARLEQGARP